MHLKSIALSTILVQFSTYTGVSFLLVDKAVSWQSQFCNPRVPNVFNQSPDIISFWDVVRSTREKMERNLRMNMKKL